MSFSKDGVALKCKRLSHQAACALLGRTKIAPAEMSAKGHKRLVGTKAAN